MTASDAPTGGGSIIRHVRSHPYHLYVLVIITIVYLLNQLDRYTYAVVKIPFINYKSTEYGLISGPLFTVVYTICGVLISYFGGAKARHRKILLATALVVWSVATGLTGFATQFWEVAAARVLQGIGEAGCTPFATALIADYFPRNVLGTAVSFYNIGIYTGYSLALSVGTAMQTSFGEGVWQPAYFIFGGIGIAFAALLLGTVQTRASADRPRAQSTSVAHTPRAAVLSVRELVRYWFSSPTLILLCIAGGVRNAGGYVWAYYTSLFFKDFRHVPKNVFEGYMGLIPLIGGSLGALAGGIISDKLSAYKTSDGSKLGPRARILVIIASNLLAAPFCLGALTLPAPQSYSDFPWAFLCLIPSNVIGEMWIGVTLTVVIESVPSHLKTTSVAIYLFIITNIGGNAPLLVSVLEGTGLNMQQSLFIMFPGVYALASVFFMVVMVFVGRDMRRARELEKDALEPLINDGGEGGDQVSAFAQDDRTKSFDVANRSSSLSAYSAKGDSTGRGL